MRLRSSKHVGFVIGRAALLVLLSAWWQAKLYLLPLESVLYDKRVHFCQPPHPLLAPSLVHLDVDDNSLSYIGRWPWPRTTMARMVDEIALAKPKVLALDVLLSEPSGVVYKRNDPTGVDADRELAAAIGRLGCAVVPIVARFEDNGPPSAYRRRMMPLLIANPELTEAECLRSLRSSQINVSYLDRNEVVDTFLQIREAALHERIDREVAAAMAAGITVGDQPDRAYVHLAVLPSSRPEAITQLDRLFDEHYDLVLRDRALRRLAVNVPAGCPPQIHASSAITPILPIAEAAGFGAFTNDLKENEEGTVRSVPLLINYRGRLLPQLGLATACAYLGADLSRARVTETRLIIPLKGDGPDVVIPVTIRQFNSRSQMSGGDYAMTMEVPLTGQTRDCLTMYDPPRYVRPVAHVSAYRVYQAVDTLERLGRNLDAVAGALSRGDKAVLASDVAGKTPSAIALAGNPRPTDSAAGQPWLEAAERNLAAYVEVRRHADASTPGEAQSLRAAQAAYATVHRVVAVNGRLNAQLADQRAGLRADLGGKSIFFGGIATALGDLHPTSLFGACPGIVIHGAIYNAILTGQTWRRPDHPYLVATAVTVGAALLTLLLVTWLPPGLAFAGSLALALAYLAFNGYVLFARHNLIVEAAGPLVAIGLVYTTVTLTNFLAEVGERARITRLFRNYQDPSLVDYMLDHPEHIRFDGEERELTVGFADIAGFTTLTDQMGAAVVPLLAEYMSHMAPIIRAKGTVLQQLGDGLLFLFGALPPGPDHPADGVAAALNMHAALTQLNRTLVDRGDRPLAMRVGLASGVVVVGDAGPPDDYTYLALGATTNLAARLESANKQFGTRILINARTASLLGDRFLLRPIANLRAVGKLACTMVYEPLCRSSDATDRDRRLAALTTEMVDAYRRADFTACATAAAALSAEFGPSKLAALYAERSASADPERDDHCDGQIVLSEK